MKVWKVLYDANIGASVVILQNEEGDRILPIWVGQSEALSIAVASEKIKMARPMTHDLVKSLLTHTDTAVEWIRVTDVKDGTYYATMRLSTGKTSVNLDTRPSDAIAVALRVDAPIFVAEHVILDALGSDSALLKNLGELEEDFLANLPDEIFGKYKM